MTMSEDTLAGATEAIEPPPTEVVYAWADEEQGQVSETRTPRSVVVVAALAGVALAVAALAAMVVLVSSRPQPDHFTIRPAPVEMPPPPVSKAVAPPIAAPPAQHLIPPAPEVQQPPVAAPNATDKFSRSLAQGHMWFRQSPSVEASEARAMCQDLANGGSVNDYIAGTERKSPQLLPSEARQVVYDAIDAYCPQYDRE